jgi:excisionase family DNA binding protein
LAALLFHQNCSGEQKMTPNTAKQGQALLTAKEAAKLLKISPATLQRLARANRAPALKIGKLWRFRKTDLDGWLDSQLRLLDPSVPRMKGKEKCIRGNDTSMDV